VNDHDKSPDQARQDEYARELDDLLNLLETVDRQITPEHITRRFRELLDDSGDDEPPAPAHGGDRGRPGRAPVSMEPFLPKTFLGGACAPHASPPPTAAAEAAVAAFNLNLIRDAAWARTAERLEDARRRAEEIQDTALEKAARIEGAAREKAARIEAETWEKVARIEGAAREKAARIEAEAVPAADHLEAVAHNLAPATAYSQADGESNCLRTHATSGEVVRRAAIKSFQERVFASLRDRLVAKWTFELLADLRVRQRESARARFAALATWSDDFSGAAAARLATTLVTHRPNQSDAWGVEQKRRARLAVSESVGGHDWGSPLVFLNSCGSAARRTEVLTELPADLVVAAPGGLVLPVQVKPWLAAGRDSQRADLSWISPAGTGKTALATALAAAALEALASHTPSQEPRGGPAYVIDFIYTLDYDRLLLPKASRAAGPYAVDSLGICEPHASEKPTRVHLFGDPRGDSTYREIPTAAAELTIPLQPDSGTLQKPDPRQAKTAQELVAALREFRTWAGQPSYRQMAERARGRAAASTICAALLGEDLPNLDVVLAVVIGCGGDEEDQQRFATAWRQIRLQQFPRLDLAPGREAGHAASISEGVSAQAPRGDPCHRSG
jgi:hypothetical protein